MTAYCQSLSPEDRYEYDREKAIEVEFRRMLSQPLSCWIDETPIITLMDVCADRLPMGAIGRGMPIRLDVGAVFRSMAERRVEAAAEETREDHARGNDL
jgi:hypothetical protein